MAEINEKEVFQMQDSGTRREFQTGAVRDMADGKGRCDLLPACAILRLSKLYEAGARKYDDRNWEKGIPLSVMVDSGMRHLLKYLDGQMDEDHLGAAAWNLLGAMWMEEKRPDLQDIPSRNYPKLDKKESEEIEWGIFPNCAVDTNDCNKLCPQYVQCNP